MTEKVWRTCRLTINGASRKVRYSQDTIDFLFLPFLRRLSHLQAKERRRILVYLAGPPCVGKSTLARLLEKLSLVHDGMTPLQAVGLLGFRYHADVLRHAYAEQDGKRVPYAQLGNAPEVFDVDRLERKLKTLVRADVRWPVFDRSLQDVVEDVVTIRKPIVLLEGDWMLLREDRWQKIRQYCDYSLRIVADPKLILDGPSAWRDADGKIPAKAGAVYGEQHRRNVRRAMQGSWAAHETWRMLPDGDYQILRDAPRPRPMPNRQSLWKQPDVRSKDLLLDSVSRRLTAMQGQGQAAYDEGYSEGLSEARRSILRRLYRNGSMGKEELQQAFQIPARELAELLRGIDRPGTEPA